MDIRMQVATQGKYGVRKGSQRGEKEIIFEQEIFHLENKYAAITVVSN